MNQEAQSQLQERVSDLTARLSAREAESNKLLCQIDELQHDVMVKTGGMDRKYLHYQAIKHIWVIPEEYL